MRGLTEGSSGTDVLAPFSRKPRKMPLSFEGLQEIRLVRFDDPGLVPGHDRLGKGQESMPPVEGGFPVDRATPSRLPDRLSRVHPFHVVAPAILVAKARQRGLRQRSEGPQTPLTPVSRESGGMTPRPDLLMVTMGAGGRDSHQSRDLFLQAFPLRLGEFVPEFFLLGRTQLFHRSQPSSEYRSFHGSALLNSSLHPMGDFTTGKGNREQSLRD